MNNSSYTIKHPSSDISYKFSESGLQVKAVLMYEEDFVDADGQPFSATKEFFEELRDNYENYLKSSIPEKVIGAIKRVIGKNVEPRFCPVLVDHDPTNALNKKGYVKSLFIETFKGASILFGELCIIDPVTISKLKDGCLREVSIGFGFDEDGSPEFREVSLIVRGAVPGAMILMSKYKKRERKDRISRISNSFKSSMNHSYHKIAQYEQELSVLEKFKAEKPKTIHLLNKMVKEGYISAAAKKAIYYKLSESDKKTQNIVYDVLKTTKRYGTVKKGHQADVRNAIRFEEFIKANPRGEGVKPVKESEKVTEGVRREVKNGSSQEISEPTNNELLKQFTGALENVRSNQKEVEKLKEENKDHQATLEEVLFFMKKGKINKAIKLAEQNSEDIFEFSEDEDQDESEDYAKEIQDLKEKVQKLKKFNKEEAINLVAELIENSKSKDFGCTNEDSTGDYTKELKKKKKMKEDDDDDDKENSRKKMKEDDDDDDKENSRKKMKEDDDDDDDDNDDDDEDFRKHKKKMKRKKMKEDDDKDDKDDKDDD